MNNRSYEVIERGGEFISHPSPNAKNARPMRVSAVRDRFSAICHPSRSFTLANPGGATNPAQELGLRVSFRISLRSAMSSWSDVAMRCATLQQLEGQLE